MLGALTFFSEAVPSSIDEAPVQTKTWAPFAQATE